MYKILIVEDDEAISNLPHLDLSDEGYICSCAFDGSSAADLLEKEVYDLILLDIMLPEINGYELLEYIKPMGIPVIFLTAKADVKDRIQGLRSGADDYIVKPFQSGEVIARIEAVLRRSGKNRKELPFADIIINLESRKAFQKGKEVELTVKEFDLLVELIQNKNVAQYRDRLEE